MHVIMITNVVQLGRGGAVRQLQWGLGTHTETYMEFWMGAPKSKYDLKIDLDRGGSVLKAINLIKFENSISVVFVGRKISFLLLPGVRGNGFR